MADYKKIFDKLLVKEGGFNNESSDYGNYCNGKVIGTKYGVSSSAYKEYYGVCPTELQMRNLSVSDAAKIWKSDVWDSIGGDDIKNDSVAEMMLDSAGGGQNGYLHIRQALNKAYGKTIVAETKTMKLTPKEVAYINSVEPKRYFDELYKIRLSYFQNHPQSSVYGKGWISRLNSVYNSFIQTAKKMANENPIKTGIAILLVSAAVAYSIYLIKSKKIG